MTTNENQNAAALSSHITIAIVIIALTGLNVFIHSMNLEPPNGTRLILFVTAIQAFLILEFLMHLVAGERVAVSLVFFTVFFVGALFFMSYFTWDTTYGERIQPQTAAAETQEAAN